MVKCSGNWFKNFLAIIFFIEDFDFIWRPEFLGRPKWWNKKVGVHSRSRLFPHRRSPARIFFSNLEIFLKKFFEIRKFQKTKIPRGGGMKCTRFSQSIPGGGWDRPTHTLLTLCSQFHSRWTPSTSIRQGSQRLAHLANFAQFAANATAATTVWPSTGRGRYGNWRCRRCYGAAPASSSAAHFPLLLELATWW